MLYALNVQIVGNHEVHILDLCADWQGGTADTRIWNALVKVAPTFLVLMMFTAGPYLCQESRQGEDRRQRDGGRRGETGEMGGSWF